MVEQPNVRYIMWQGVRIYDSEGISDCVGAIRKQTRPEVQAKLAQDLMSVLREHFDHADNIVRGILLSEYGADEGQAVGLIVYQLKAAA